MHGKSYTTSHLCQQLLHTWEALSRGTSLPVVTLIMQHPGCLASLLRHGVERPRSCWKSTQVAPLLAGVFGPADGLHGGSIHLGRLVLQQLCILLPDQLSMRLAQIRLCVLAGGEAAGMCSRCSCSGPSSLLSGRTANMFRGQRLPHKLRDFHQALLRLIYNAMLLQHSRAVLLLLKREAALWSMCGAGGRPKGLLTCS